MPPYYPSEFLCVFCGHRYYRTESFSQHLRIEHPKVEKEGDSSGGRDNDTDSDDEKDGILERISHHHFPSVMFPTP
jgi:hypothetical protein